MSGGTGLARAIGGYWARVGEWLEVVAQTEDSGLLWAVAVSASEDEGQTVVTQAGEVVVTVERVVCIEAGHRSRKGVRRELMVLD